MSLKDNLKQLHLDYKDAMKFCLIYQVILGMLGAFVLDGGQLFQYWVVSMIAFWCSVAILVLRGATAPTKLDILYVKFGFFLILIIVPLAMDFAWRVRGK